MAVSEFARWFGETSLAVSLLIVFILVVRRPVARRFGPEAAYLLWIAPLVRLATPELGVLPASWRETAPAAAGQWTLAAAPVEAILADAPSRAAVDPMTAIFALWLAGAVIFLAAQFNAQRKFMAALLGAAAAPSPELAAEAAAIAERSGLKKPPRIVVARDATGPLVAGFFDPVVALPADFERAYSSVERRLALSHEFAHVRRGDLATTFAALLFRAAEWPNPLVHIAFRAFRADQEAACDAAVLARNAGFPDVSYVYGAAIVKSAASRFSAPAASLAMSNHIKERLMLMKNGKKGSAAVGRALAAALIIAGVAASASYSYAADKDAKKEKTVVKTEKKVSSVNVFSGEGDEELRIDGVEGAKKIEVRNENGERTVKIWDKDGKLISENVYGPDDKMPFETIVMIEKDGKKKVVTLDALQGHPRLMGGLSDLEGLGDDRKVMIFRSGDGGDNAFAWDFGDDDGGPGEKRKFVVVVGDDGPSLDLMCDTMEVKAGEDGADKDIRCLSSADAKDPAARAAALKKAIAHMEESARKQAEHREKLLAKLRAELAEAEKEAKKK